MKINLKQSLILISLLMLILVFTSTVILAQNSSDEELEIPTTADELIAKFNILEYSVVVLRKGEKIQDSIISYQYDGEEEIDDVLTDKVSFEITNNTSDGGNMPSDMILWFNEDELVQMEVDGKVFSKQAVQMMGDRLLQSVLLPFYSFSEFDVDKFKKIGHVSRSQEIISDQELDIIKIVVEDLPEYEIESVEAELAEFENFMMAISYNYVSSEDDMEVKFNTEAFELR